MECRALKTFETLFDSTNTHRDSARGWYRLDNEYIEVLLFIFSLTIWKPMNLFACSIKYIEH